MKRRKILIFTEYFLPGYKAGGPIRSIYNLAKVLSNEYLIYIITKDRDIGENKSYDNIKTDEIIEFEGFRVLYLSTVNTGSVQKAISNIEPDVIYLNGLFSKFTQIILFLKKMKRINQNLILAPRGEVQPNALQMKSLKKKIYMFVAKIFSLHDDIVFHSTDKTETVNIEKQLNTSEIYEISNISMPLQKFAALSKKKNQLNIIFLSRIRDNKNLMFALSVLKDFDFDICFDIYGPIEDKSYWEKCQAMINKLPKNIKCKYYGSVKPEDVASTMRKYHCKLLPTKTENFGHVIAESMFAGVVPIISDQTPWLDLEKEQAGWDIALDDIDAYKKAVEDIYDMDEDEYEKLSKSTMLYVEKKLDISKVKQDYIELFK